MPDNPSQNDADLEPRVRERKRKSPGRRVVHGVSWVVAIPVLLFLVAYLFLLVRPLPLPFVGNQARAMVLNSLPPNMELELGEIYLTLKNGVEPAISFSPVVLKDLSTGGRVEMAAFEVGFLPLRALVGQPGAQITLVEPKLQVVQDLFGPRLAQFDVVDDPEGGHPIVRILQGENSFPSVDIKSEGIDIRVDARGAEILGSPALTLRSDNDWLVFNLEAGEAGLRSIIESSERGLFSRFSVRNGILEMHDSVYGLVRTFSGIEMEISPERGNPDLTGSISSIIAGERAHGTILRRVEDDGSVRLLSSISNLDFSAFIPFMDDPDGMMAVHGNGDLAIDVRFASSKDIDVLGGTFLIDLDGTNFRIQNDNFPVRAQPARVEWDAREATFNMQKTRIQAGKSYAEVSGVFAMGVDENFGPTSRISINITNMYLHPEDMEAPESLIEEAQFLGWSAPLYGAIGIEHLAISSGDLKVVGSGRFDMLSRGFGLDIDLALEGASADDIKRMWPYFLGRGARDWFVDNVKSGKVISSLAKFNFPIGTIGGLNEDQPLPEGALEVEMLAEGVSFSFMEGFEVADTHGLTHLKVENSEATIGIAAAKLPVVDEELEFSDTTINITWPDAQTGILAFSGNVGASFDALLALKDMVAIAELDELELPIDLNALSGHLDTALVATVTMNTKEGEVLGINYALNGKIENFASSEPISTYTIADGQFDFDLSTQTYNLSGPVKINGLNTRVVMQGEMKVDSTPRLEVSADFAASDFKEFGFDVSSFIGGRIRFSGQPLSDGSLKMFVDLKNSSMDVPDIGLSKSSGTPGSLTALVSFDGPLVNINDIDLSFGDVKLLGTLQYHQETGLRAADFPRFAINKDDNAQLKLSPIDGGYAVRLRGSQLDLKPLMGRFFSLDGGGTGGPQAAGLEETILLDVEIERALGFFSTTAINLDVDLRIQGDELQQLNLVSQFGGANSLAITTNPGPTGRVMSLAFGDLGTLLRFTGVYPRLVGGAGSLTLTKDNALDVDFGEFSLTNFSFIEEQNVAQILGNHPDSRERIARENRLDVRSGKAQFIQHSDRIELVSAVIDAGTQGGTARGFIYTDEGEYDIVGTYIPLFGINNAFQNIPILGPILGGRDGEGMFGVTFAIKGNLNDPSFNVNPLSLLLPGVFRTLFEFRATDQSAN